MEDARENRKSPTMMATVLSHRLLAEGTPRRISASSMTSSWYRLATWVSSMTTAARSMADASAPG